MPTPTTGISSIGTTFEIAEDSGFATNNTALGTVLKVGGFSGGETEFQEDKSLGQADRGVASIPTWIKLGTVTIGIKHDQTVLAQLLAWQQAIPVKRLYGRLTFPKQPNSDGSLQAAASKAVFRVYVQHVPPEFPEDGGRVTADIVLKIDSLPVFTPGTTLT